MKSSYNMCNDLINREREMKLNTRKMAALFAVVFTTLTVGLESLLKTEFSLGVIFVTAFLTVTTLIVILTSTGHVSIDLAEETV